MGIGNIMLILGNGPTKRMAVYGLALQYQQANKGIVWCRFLSEETEEIREDTIPFRDIDYRVVDLTGFRPKQLGGKVRNRFFLVQWEAVAERISSGHYDIVILEELDTALDVELVKTDDVLNLLLKGKAEQFIVSGKYLPAGILGMANKLVEIWEREND